LSGIRRTKPSKLTFAVTGSTVLTAAAGVVALWPPTLAARPAADALTAARGASASSVRAEARDTVAMQTQALRTDTPQRHLQSVVLVAEQAAARQAAARRRAAERAVAAAAARRAAEQAAEQSQQSQSPPQQDQSGPPPTPSGSAQQIALGMLGSYGWSSGQFSCLVSLWNRESGWNVTASNGSGAYGIPQALPADKMASAGPDWQTDAATQIRWGLGYIKGLYGSPCGAWAHEEADGWY
jgi:hypothetical protein